MSDVLASKDGSPVLKGLFGSQKLFDFLSQKVPTLFCTQRQGKPDRHVSSGERCLVLLESLQLTAQLYIRAGGLEVRVSTGCLLGLL